MAMKNPRKNWNLTSAGYSLVELMVVVSIIGITLGVAMTNLARKSPNQHRENAQWQIASDLRLARQQALSQNTDVQITFDNAADTYSIWTDADRDGIQDAGEIINRSVSEHKGANLWVYPVSATFTPQGNMKTRHSFWYISVFVPDSNGYKYVYVFENGHIDPDGAS